MIVEGHVFEKGVCIKCSVLLGDVFYDVDMARDSRHSVTRCVGVYPLRINVIP